MRSPLSFGNRLRNHLCDAVFPEFFPRIIDGSSAGSSSNRSFLADKRSVWMIADPNGVTANLRGPVINVRKVMVGHEELEFEIPDLGKLVVHVPVPWPNKEKEEILNIVPPSPFHLAP